MKPAEMKNIGMEHGLQGKRTSTIVENVDAVTDGSTEHIYLEIGQNTNVMYEVIDEVAANPLVKADDDRKAAVASHSSDPDGGGGVYEDMSGNGSVAVNPAGRTTGRRTSSLYL